MMIMMMMMMMMMMTLPIDPIVSVCQYGMLWYGILGFGNANYSNRVMRQVMLSSTRPFIDCATEQGRQSSRSTSSSVFSLLPFSLPPSPSSLIFSLPALARSTPKPN